MFEDRAVTNTALESQINILFPDVAESEGLGPAVSNTHFYSVVLSPLARTTGQ